MVMKRRLTRWFDVNAHRDHVIILLFTSLIALCICNILHEGVFLGIQRSWFCLVSLADGALICDKVVLKYNAT